MAEKEDGNGYILCSPSSCLSFVGFSLIPVPADHNDQQKGPDNCAQQAQSDIQYSSSVHQLHYCAGGPDDGAQAVEDKQCLGDLPVLFHLNDLLRFGSYVSSPVHISV